MQIVGYPERMRAYNARLKAKRSDRLLGKEDPSLTANGEAHPLPWTPSTGASRPRWAPSPAGTCPSSTGGTLSEHKAVRESVGVFDLSHLGKVEVRGQGAHDALQHALSNDLDRLAEPGAAQYTLCLTDEGTIVDDLIVYREADGWLLVPNAANWPKVADAVRASDPGRTEVTPRPDVAVLAVQGPRAPQLVGGLFPMAADLPYMHMATTAYQGAPARVCRTGYTGERGFELLVPGEAAPALWEALFERGRRSSPSGWAAATPCGWRWATPCTTTSPPTPTRSRPASAGPWPWTRATSGAARPWPPARRPAPSGCWSASSPATG